MVKSLLQQGFRIYIVELFLLFISVVTAVTCMNLLFMVACYFPLLNYKPFKFELSYQICHSSNVPSFMKVAGCSYTHTYSAMEVSPQDNYTDFLFQF